MKALCHLILLTMIYSCAAVRSVSQTSIPAKKGKLVKAEVKNNIIFLLNFSTSHVNDLSLQLAKACPGGKVEGILTKDVLITYFPIIFYKEHITAEGYCAK